MATDLSRRAPTLHSWSFIFQHFHYRQFLSIETTKLCNYAGDSTMYSSDKNSNIVISRVRHDFAKIPESFYENYIVLNPDKFRFLTLGFNQPFPDFCFENTIIKNITEEKILGIVMNNNLSFKCHMKKYAKKSIRNSVHLQEFQN